jgi:diguanylate cyclase (GGDEF)-like protein/PAS domain S-box-containing protein
MKHNPARARRQPAVARLRDVRPGLAIFCALPVLATASPLITPAPTLAMPALLFLLQALAAGVAGWIATSRARTGVLVGTFSVVAAGALLAAAAQVAGPGLASAVFWGVARVAEVAAVAAVCGWRRRHLSWGAALAVVLLLVAAWCEWHALGYAALAAAVLRIGAYVLLARSLPQQEVLPPVGAQLPHGVVFQVVVDAQGRPRVSYVSASIAHVNGLQAADVYRNPQLWLSQMPPEDRADLLARCTGAQQQVLETSVRILRPDGALRWMRVSAASSTDSQGRVIWDGLQSDITERRQAALRALETDDQWLAVLRRLPGGITRFDASLHIRFVNETHAHWYGRSVADMLGRSLADILPPERYARLEPQLQQALAGDTVVFENQVQLAPGDVRYRHNTMVPERGSDGSVLGVLSFVIDITEQKQTELALADQQSRLRSLFAAIPDMLFSKDRDSVYTSCNQLFADFVGRTPQQVVGLTDYDMPISALADNARVEDRHVMESGEALRSESQVALPGTVDPIFFETIKAPLRDAGGAVVGVVGVARDVTERKRAEREIEQLAFYDALTALPNRRRLLPQLEEAAWVAAAAGSHGAVLLVNLDHFKNLNDVLGHEAGEQLLQLAAQRLREGVPTSQVVAHVGGDEFALVLDALGGDAAEAAQAAQKLAVVLLDLLSRPFDLAGRRHYGSASIGIRLFSQPALPAEELLQQAGLAVGHAKQEGRNTQRFFDPAMQQALNASAALEADLHDALALQQFLLHYQPVVDMHGHMVGAEALLRWRHPVRGMVAPGAFIGLAEDNGLILPLGGWVLRAACEQLVAWSGDAVMRHWYLAVNVSARQFRHPDFLTQVDAVLNATGVDPRRLKLELTETVLLRDTDETLDKLALLKARGMGLSLDDFGTGFSSLGYLRRLPLDQLKIDQSFVRDMLADANGAAIVRTILALAESLGLDVVAEGVETHEQHDFLMRSGCRAYQGYLFARPMPVDEMERSWGGRP